MAELCNFCKKEIPRGVTYKTERLVSTDKEGRYLGETIVKKCMACFYEAELEKREAASRNPLPISDGMPRTQSRLF